MNPNASPEQMKAQMTEQLRVITFVHGQKQTLMIANSKMIAAIGLGMDDLSSMFTKPVVEAQLEILHTQNKQLNWEIENLERDMDKLKEILGQLASPILRPMPMPMPPPTGPRNIR